jgi:hypothetical protein
MATIIRVWTRVRLDRRSLSDGSAPRLSAEERSMLARAGSG